MRIWAITISLIGLLGTAHAMTQQTALIDTTGVDSIRTYRLPEIVVTATRSPKYLHDVGRSIAIITSDKIRETASITLSDLVSRQPGTYVVGATQTPGSLQSIHLRGASTNHAVILFDGIPITDPSSTDNAIDLSELSLVGVEKIEIIRGSHSTMYGSSAIGGTLNLFSHGPLSPGLHTDASITYEAFGRDATSLSENILLDYTTNNGLFLSTGLFNTRVNGINSTIDTVGRLDHRPDQDNFSKTDFLGKVGYGNDGVKAHLLFKQAFQESDIDDGAYQDDDNYTVETRRRILSGNASYAFSDAFRISYIGGITDLKRLAIDDSSVVDNLGTTDHSYLRARYESYSSTNELQANIRLLDFEVSLGVGLLQEEMSSDIYYLNTEFAFESRSNFQGMTPRATTQYAFAHADLSGVLFGDLLEDLTLGLGARYNNHTNFGHHTTLEINPAFRVSPATLFYVSYSTGFLAPPLYRLYALEQDLSSGITRGNKGLKPESSRSFEVGLKQRISDKTSFTASYFRTITDDIIDYVYLWERNKPVSDLTYLDYRGDTYLNVGQHHASGIEIEVSTQLTDKISLVGNLSLVGGTLSYDDSQRDTTHIKSYQVQVFANGLFLSGTKESFELVRRPNTANLRMTYDVNEALSLTLDASYVGQRNDFFYETSLGPFGGLSTTAIEGYGLIGIAVRYGLTQNLTAHFMIQNILNAQYSEIRGYASVGRTISATLRHTL